MNEVVSGIVVIAFSMEVTPVQTMVALPAAFVVVMAPPFEHFVGQVPVVPFVPEVNGVHESKSVPVCAKKVQTELR